MKYHVEKKLNFDGFKEITRDEIVDVRDNYIWIRFYSNKKVKDINGLTLFECIYPDEIMYLGHGFFKKVFKSKAVKNKLFKCEKYIPNINDIIFNKENILGRLEDSYVLLDDDGNIISKKYKFIRGFSNNMSPICEENIRKSKWGFIDNKGFEIVKPCYDSISSFNNHLATICLKGKWGVIDDNLNFVINPTIKCNSLSVVSESLLLVNKKKSRIVTDFSGKVIYKLSENESAKLDYENKVIYIYKDDYDKCDNFDNVIINSLNLKIVNDSLGMNCKYTKIITSDYKEIDIKYFHIEEINRDNTLKFTSGKYGVLSKDYNVSKEYDSVKSTSNNNYIVSKNNKIGIINREDVELLPILYNRIKYDYDGEYYSARNDNETILLDNNLHVINRFKSEQEIVQYKDNLLVIFDNNQYHLLDYTFKKIVSSDNKIFILNDNKVIVENHLIDLNQEYIDLNPIYELNININENNYSATFKTKEKLDERIKELEKIEEYYSKEESVLNKELESIEGKINKVEKEKVMKIIRLLK